MRKRKTFAIRAIAAVVLISCLTIWVVVSTKKIDGGNSTEDTNIPPLLKDAVLLEKLVSDKDKKAEEKLAELSTRKDSVGYLASITLADRYSEQGKDAAEYYSHALELYDTNQVRLKLASYLSKKGQYLDAAKMYASALPDSSALDNMLKLPISPDVIGGLLVDYKQWQSASDFLKIEISKASDDISKIKLEKLYARVLTEMTQYKEALPLLEKLQVSSGEDNDIKLYYARSLENTGQTKKAKEVYKSLGTMGAYKLGLVLEKEGNLKDAAAAFILSSEPDSLWKGARILDEMGNRDKALEIYKKLSQVQGAYQDDAAYRAYVLLNKIKGPGADDMLSIISSYPVWMARLNKESPWASVADITYSKPEFLDRMEAYEKSGRTVMAQIELAIGENNADLPGKLAIGDWYLSQGDYYQAAKWGMKAIKEQPVRHGYELAYQRPYNEYVTKSASEFDIDPDLVWALMREESYYDQNAVSRVGALGLTQIMPDTGKYIASKLKTEFHEEDLLKPEINIRFGAYYLKSLLNMFSGDIDKALASYNGGSGNVKKWSSSNIGNSKEGFPTAVSFTETREYITKVGNSYYIYKRLYESK